MADSFLMRNVAAESTHRFFLVVKALIAASGALLGAIWLAPFLMRLPWRDTVSLHSTVFLGIDFIGDGKEVITIPVVAVIVTAVHSALAFYLRRVPYMVITLLVFLLALLALLMTAIIYLYILNL